MYDITALGEILIDFTPAGKNDCGNDMFAQNPGGAPANVLAAMSKYGAKTAFIGKVGQDAFGEFLIKTLIDNGIDASGVSKDEVHNTTLAFVSLDDTGDRSFSFYRRFGADVFLKKDDIPSGIIENSGIFHFGSLSLTAQPAREATEYALKKAKESGCIISFDPNYRELLWDSERTAVKTILEYMNYADIMKVSKEEAIMLSGERDVHKAAKQLCGMGVKIVLVTDGANGVTYRFGDKCGFVPAIKVKAVDTTGAGDIFFGTFLNEFVKDNKAIDEISEEDIEKYIKAAVRTSGLSTTKNGAIPSIPDLEEAKRI